ncbi:unnamed protein product, partial [Ascophyllum nodosum]
MPPGSHTQLPSNCRLCPLLFCFLGNVAFPEYSASLPFPLYTVICIESIRVRCTFPFGWCFSILFTGWISTSAYVRVSIINYRYTLYTYTSLCENIDYQSPLYSVHLHELMCMERTLYVSFQMVFFYLVITGWVLTSAFVRISCREETHRYTADPHGVDELQALHAGAVRPSEGKSSAPE